MVVIRLSRSGTNKRPFYHVMVADKRRACKKGRVIEPVGFYNPIATGGETKLQLNNERIQYWISQGAQLSKRVASIMKDAPTSGLPA